ncbi:MAG: hypothetical protein J5614_02040 [Paludibacteraceae bacterium]|nr:hypothetical protein [Paludibacteraceae bacterium]
MMEYAHDRYINAKYYSAIEFMTYKNAAEKNKLALEALYEVYDETMSIDPYDFPRPEWFETFTTTLEEIHEAEEDFDNDKWKELYYLFKSYNTLVNQAFGPSTVNVNGGVEIQLVPFVEYSLMNTVTEDGDDLFVDFVTAFTQVHKAIEPVIFKRLDGNHYLDCKLIGTYGKSRTYVCDTDRDNFWPNLNIQIEFDVNLYNKGLATNTIDELRSIVKSYFNKLTTVHYPNKETNMDVNIYISHLIQQMEAHDNVAWMKFKGWFTDQKGKAFSEYKDANTQSLELKYKQLEEMGRYNDGTSLLENYNPEMFILEKDNIKINIV